MINKFLADINIIKNAINTKKLVVFAGAGVSVDAGVPSWGRLIEEIKKELDLPDNENDFLKIPQIFYNERQEKEYIEKIRSVLAHKKLKHNEIHDEIFELNPEHILTTNLEDLLEQVINKKSLPYSTVKKDIDLPYSHNTKLLVKIHGDLDGTDFVLKEDDYLNYNTNHPLIEAFIKSVFASKTVLFIGYSYNDFNLKQIVQSVRNILGSNFQNAYLLSIDNKLHFSHRQYLQNKGIKIIDYFEADSTNSNGVTINYIEDYLKGNNFYNENYYAELNNLSEKGQKLYNFLRFIKIYDKLKIPIDSKNVINQTYESLNRFSELKSLPQEFISKIYPFKASNESFPLIRDTTLLLTNKTLVDVFFEQIKIKNDEIEYLPKNKETKSEAIENEKKITKIIKILNDSLIFKIDQENAIPDSLGYKGFSNKPVNIYINSKKSCNCTKCQWNNFKLNESLADINSYSINEISDVSEDAQKAYFNYKFGNYLIAFKMYEEIATKSWSMGKYITYYIAKINMKSLKGLINYNEDSIKEDEKGKIINKIGDIDTDKLIFQIPYKSNEEYELLKIIRDDSILSESKNQIDELYNKVLKTYHNYKSKHYNEVGTYYPSKVYIELFKILNFYTENYIISDVFSNFKNVVQRGIESIMINYATSNQYSGKAKELSSSFVYFSLFYCDSDSLKTFFKRYEIKEIKIAKEDQPKTFEYFNNFFNSFFKKSNFLFKNHFENETIINQLSKDLFEGKVTSIFRNIMLLLLYIEIPKQYKSKLIQNFILFLENEKDILNNSTEYVDRFIDRHYKNFSFNDCERLLKIISEKKHNHRLINILKTIADIAQEQKFELITDKTYAIKLITIFKERDYNKDVIIHIIKMSNNEIRSELTEELIKELKSSFDISLYVEACYNKAIDYNTFFEEYLTKINSLIKKDEPDYFEVDDKLKFHNFIFHNALIFIYYFGVKPTDTRLNLLNNANDFKQFFLFRQNSDINKFKPEWLLLVESSIIHQELSKIKKLKKIIEDELRENYNQQLSEIYSKYYL